MGRRNGELALDLLGQSQKSEAGTLCFNSNSIHHHDYVTTGKIRELYLPAELRACALERALWTISECYNIGLLGGLRIGSPFS